MNVRAIGNPFMREADLLEINALFPTNTTLTPLINVLRLFLSRSITEQDRKFCLSAGTKYYFTHADKYNK